MIGFLKKGSSMHMNENQMVDTENQSETKEGNEMEEGGG